MTRVVVVGAGQLGSRHLQALRKVTSALEITVVDPSLDSLRVARERYEAIEPGAGHSARFEQQIPAGECDLAIVATSSNVRRQVVESLLKQAPPRRLILEKLLFQSPADYEAVAALLATAGTQTFVNCTMRAMPFYSAMRDWFSNDTFSYEVTGSQYGLVTNAIHYVDHMCYLAGREDFSVDTSLLDPNPIPSKRPGFLELNGTLRVTFAGGSHAAITCHPSGDMPVQVEVQGPRARCIVREWEGMAWVARASTGWKYEEAGARIPYQSEMTTSWVEDLLAGRDCPLVEYAESARVHTRLLEPLRSFLNHHSSEKRELYPFT